MLGIKSLNSLLIFNKIHKTFNMSNLIIVIDAWFKIEDLILVVQLSA